MVESTQGFSMAIWVWVKNETPGTAGFSPLSHLPGFHFGYLKLTGSAPTKMGSQTSRRVRTPASDGMLPTTQAILCPMGGDDVETFRLDICRRVAELMACLVVHINSVYMFPRSPSSALVPTLLVGRVPLLTYYRKKVPLF